MVDWRLQMATYVIGDVQGQWSELERLLAVVRFDPAVDRLWFVGDLVNRGPQSLAVVRFVKSLGRRSAVVLGNHDLHLLGRALGVAPKKRHDTLDEILAAPDRDEIITWLQQRPLLVREQDRVLVHAGLLPQWSVSTATRLAREVETVLRSRQAAQLLATYTHSRADTWHPSLRGLDRWVVILNAFTRLRTCTRQGRMRLDFNGPPSEAPVGFRPWFSIRGRKSRNAFVLFGHWAALRLKLGKRYAALDSGCCWGEALSALRLEDVHVFTVECRTKRPSRP